MELSAYPIFDFLFKSATGKDYRDFSFKKGIAPLSTWSEVVAICLTYYLVILGGQYLMKHVEKPIKLNWVFRLHNFFLTVSSLFLAILFLENIIPSLRKNGLFFTICNRNLWTRNLETLYYINYLVKYYELLDTVFLVLRKKRVEFLHWFHHSMTMVLCFTQLVGETVVSWVPVTLNLGVHVFMYYYYLKASFGIRVWWKKYVTVLQIVQFVADLGFTYFCLYNYFASTYFPYLPYYGHCSGSEQAGVFGCALLTFYLMLFIRFFIRTYVSSKAKKPTVSERACTPKPAAGDRGTNGANEVKKKVQH